MIKLFEQFNNEQEIHDLCKEYRIKDYTINSDGSIDVNGNVNLSACEIRKIPIKFNKVNGYFSCLECDLTTLENSPRIVMNNFKCSWNDLTSLEGCPDFIYGDFDCNQNYIEDFKYFPKHVEGMIFITNNKIKSLKGLDGSYYGISLTGNITLKTIDNDLDIKKQIFCGKTSLPREIISLDNEDRVKVFNHSVEYGVFDKDGNFNRKRFEMMMKDLE